MWMEKKRVLQENIMEVKQCISKSMPIKNENKENIYPLSFSNEMPLL